ncbi:amidohydrolase [Curtobacterium pusillum]|uniref:amidohydrolase n=1 Tax=Curtobacterium pusillum TaxID=69373 RepID=UPI0011A6853E|nr:amidohydrolase [Curtobacterium pusillum]
MSAGTRPELVVLNARIYTSDGEAGLWAEAFACQDGTFVAVGSNAEIAALAGPDTVVRDLDGAFVLPGLSDVHAHLILGGTLEAWELPLQPTDSKEEVLGKVRAWAENLEPGEWIVGGIVGSTVLDSVTYDVEALAALDEAAGGRPVLLRDDSMHNRWVNSAALAAMGVGADTPDPEGGRYVRDDEGRLTGVLHEMASGDVEAAHDAAVADPAARNKVSLSTALKRLNSFGITSVQEAASMPSMFEGLSTLEDEGQVTAWVVASMPIRPFLEPGPTGTELYPIGEAHRTAHVRPDFVKVVLDGVPMTRTTAMLSPYICHDHTEDPDFRGDTLWKTQELVEALREVTDHGLNAKLHATGDASTRVVLDAVEQIRAERGDDPIFQIAHTEFIDPDDVPRFAALGVVPDASPHIWYPGVIQESIGQQIPAETIESSWPNKDLLDSGALLAAGSDWPCSLPTPNPWVGLETIVTRRNPDPAIDAVLNESQALTVAEAIAVFTANPARAMGLEDVTGRIRTGLSADFAILDRDLFEIPANDIHNTVVLETFFEGRQVFSARQ